MELLVCVKLVSESHYTDSFRDTPEDRLSSGRLVMNPADEYALELALRLKEDCPGSTVTLLALAPKSVQPILQTGLAMGADRAIHLCDPRFAGSDTLATSAALAAAIHTIGFRGLVLCGQKAIDSETGHIGPQLAYQLGLSAVTGVLSLKRDGEGIQVEQVRDQGTAILLCPSAAVLTICRGTQMVRRPTISGLRAAQHKELKVLSYTDLIDVPQAVGSVGSPTRLIRVTPILHRKRGGVTCADVEAGAQLILGLLGKEAR